MCLRGHHNPPVQIVGTRIVDQHGFRMVKKQHAAQPIFTASIADQFRMASRIAYSNPEVVVSSADVVRHSRPSSRKHKNSRFTIVADLVVDKSPPAFRTVDDDAG